MLSKQFALFGLAVVLSGCQTAPSGSEGGSLNQPDTRPVDPTLAALPYVEVEAEACRTDGTAAPESTVLNTAASEASGRRYVQLNPGQRLAVPAPMAGNSLVVRVSWPGPEDGSLEVTAAGVKSSVTLTSRYSWDYGPAQWGTSDVWAGVDGPARHYWDEVNLRTPDYRAGSEVVLTNPAGSAEAVLVDLIDFEAVPGAVVPPPGCLNFADLKPDTTGQTDVSALLQQALDQAQGRVVYVPEGTYLIGAVYLGGAHLQGAGLWRTRLVGPYCQLRFAGKTARVSDLALFGETQVRDDTSEQDDAFSGNPGPGTVLERLWIEHKKSAFWVGTWGGKNPVNGLTVTQCRVRDTMAEGLTLGSGTTGSTVKDCLFRNTGDDALVALSPKDGGPSGGSNSFIANLVQSAWLGSAIALYGGGPLLVEGNVLRDTVTAGSGIAVASTFGTWPFVGPVDIRGNVLVRCGAHENDAWGATGAIRLAAIDSPLGTAQMVLADNVVISPLECAVSIQGPQAIGGVRFRGLRVTGLGPEAPVVDVKANAQSGEVVFTGVELPDGSVESRKAFPQGKRTLFF